MSYRSGTDLNSSKDRRSLKITNRTYEQDPDLSQFNPNEDDEYQDQSQEENQFFSIKRLSAREQETSSLIPQSYLAQSEKIQTNLQQRSQSERFGGLAQEQESDNYESMIEAMFEKPQSITQNLYKKRASVKKTKHEILQIRSSTETILNSDVDENFFDNQFSEKKNQPQKNKQLITPTHPKIVEIADENVSDDEKQKSISQISPIKKQELNYKEDSIDIVEKQNDQQIIDKGQQESDSSDEEDLIDDQDFRQDHLKMMSNEQLNEVKDSSLTQIISPQKENKQKAFSQQENVDMIKLVDQNERLHQEQAREKLKKDSVISLNNVHTENIFTRILTDFKLMKKITNKIIKEEQYNSTKATSIGISDDLIIYGTSDGHTWMFDRESEEEYVNFIDKSKDFSGNAVTAIDIHPTRPEYIVLGYMRGQLVLLDATEPKKSLKVIKDHHKGVQIVNIKFCDWRGKIKHIEGKHEDDSNSSVNSSQLGSEYGKDKQLWMFISIDEEGRVIVNTVSKFLVFKASKQVLIDPSVYNGPKFVSITNRFYSQMHPQGDENDLTTIVALGNAVRVHLFKIKPTKFEEIIRIPKPKYYYSKQKNAQQEIKPVAPSMSWGFGHTPIFKDKPYSILAISWGPLIQLVVLNDLNDQENPFFIEGFYLLKEQEQILSNSKLGEEYEQIVEEDSFKNDLDNSFKQSNLFIEGLHFISDSTLLVLTRGLEIRILDTEKFHPEEFYNDMERKYKAFQEGKLSDLIEEVRVAELSQGVMIKNIKSSMFGVKYGQTFKFFNGMGVILSDSQVLQFKHLSWQESLQEFKKEADGAWINVFARALDFYRGKIKGFRGVTEDKEIRENTLKAELKLLIRDFIQEAIDKQHSMQQKFNQTSTQQFTSDSSSFLEDSCVFELREQFKQLEPIQDDKNQNYRTFVKIAIEFCVELQDCYFLFYDLFLFFQDEKMEDIFVSELEPFIMAGKFTEWEIPNDILQNHLINYYKEQAKPENLEKIIINLNFKNCPKQIVLGLIHYCNQHFLTTGILFLHTQVFERKDNTSCAEVLFSLSSLYRDREKTNKGSYEQVLKILDFGQNSSEKLEIEKSAVYIGYKILWIIRLFITGKKFPQGSIRERKWRVYVQDIVSFITNKDILSALLEVDAEAFFQILSIMFYEGKPFDFVAMPRDPEYNKENTISMNHSDILTALNVVCQDYQDDHIRLQYLFFVANVATLSNIHQEPIFYFNIVKGLLKEHQKFLYFNQHVLTRTITGNKLQRKLSRQLVEHVPDQFKHLIKSEMDLITLVQKCEPMTDDQLQELLKLSSETEFKQVRVFLLEKKEDFIQCLQLLLQQMKGNETWQNDYFSEKAFDWIRDKLKVLEEKSGQSQKYKIIFDQFKREVLDNIKLMVLLNVNESITLIDEKFDSIHKEVIDQLVRYPQEQLLYLETFLTIKQEHIQNTIKEFSLQSTNSKLAKKYLELLKLHLKLCCMQKKNQVLSIVEKIVQHSYYPTEDCLKICLEYDQIEACALLSKKLGKYFESVQLYIQVLKNKVHPDALKNELKYASIHKLSTQYCVMSLNKLPITAQFDQNFKDIMKICKKNHGDVDIGKEEEIWYSVLDMLFYYKTFETTKKSPVCKQFIRQRILIFSKILLNFVKFQNFLAHVIKQVNKLKWKEMRELILDVFNDVRTEQIILHNANYAIYKTTTSLFKDYQDISSVGILFRSLRCYHCKQYLDHSVEDFQQQTSPELEQELDDEIDYDPFNEHTFHAVCLQKICLLRKEDTIEIKKQKEDKLRCPKCYHKNFDIDNLNGSPVRPRGRGGQITGQKPSNIDIPEQQEEGPIQSKKMVREKLRSQTIQSKQISKLRKRIENFDQSLEQEGLTSKNFKY